MHPLLSTEPSVSLSRVHTMSAATFDAMAYVLRTVLPAFIECLAETDSPIRVVIVDSITEVFHFEDKATTSTLVRRSQQIAELSVLLHTLAATFDLAVLVVNDVTDSFNDTTIACADDLLYQTSAQWFDRPGPEPSATSTSLGLAWANQMNARLFISRCHDYLSPPASSVQSVALQSVRRLSVIFNHLSNTASTFFAITSAGITTQGLDSTSEPSLQATTQIKSIREPQTHKHVSSDNDCYLWDDDPFDDDECIALSDMI
jgi:hypothetical protein